MKQDRFFYSGITLAFGLLYVSFHWQPIEFWVIFPISLFILSVWSWIFEQHELRGPAFQHLFVAIFSGLILYSLFSLGKWLLILTGLPLIYDLTSLYSLVQPNSFLHYIWLFIIIVPGEEWFWRGFIVKRLSNHMTNYYASIYGTLLYASAHFVAGSFLLVLAALLAGFVWSIIYLQTNNIWVPIASHFIFNLFLLVLFPLI